MPHVALFASALPSASGREVRFPAGGHQKAPIWLNIT